MIITFKLDSFINNLKLNSNLLGIDYGIKNIGLAISDEVFSCAVPLLTIVDSNIDIQINKIYNLILTYSIGGIVIGLPLYLNGTISNQTEKVKYFSNILLKKSNIPILFEDERLTSKAAHKILKYHGLSRKKCTTIDHQVAAMIILDNTINKIKKINNK